LANGDPISNHFTMVDSGGDNKVKVELQLSLMFTLNLTVLCCVTQPARETTVANNKIQCIDNCHCH